MAEIVRMIEQTARDRTWFSRQAVQRGIGEGENFRHHHGSSIDAAACAIREKALRVKDIVALVEARARKSGRLGT